MQALSSFNLSAIKDKIDEAIKPQDDRDYKVPFKFTGKIAKLTIKLDPPKLSEAEEKLLKQEGQRNNKASE